MRVAYALQGLVAASTAMAASYNPQFVVLGTDGTVVVDADPNLYFRTSTKLKLEELVRTTNQFFEEHDQLEDVVASDLTSKQTEIDELPMILLPSIDDELPASHDVANNQEIVEDDFSSTASPALIQPSPWTIADEIETPGVYGSIIFAELSCCFVAFVGYLVTTIPLWAGFSRGQKCCIVAAFMLALLYQFAAVGWIIGVVAPEFMLGLSSLITRMISLGMVPITTTSFMCRAREICQDQTTVASTGRKSSHSRSSRRHHARARAS